MAAATQMRLDRQTIAQLRVCRPPPRCWPRRNLKHRVGEAGESLTTAEWDVCACIRTTRSGSSPSSSALAPMAPIVGLHHERLDGSGYHRGCGGSAIGSAARVLAAADALQAMTQRRPHRPALDLDQARDELLGETRRGRFDPDAVSAVLASSRSTTASAPWCPASGRPHRTRGGGPTSRGRRLFESRDRPTAGGLAANGGAPRSAHLHQTWSVEPGRRRTVRTRA